MIKILSSTFIPVPSNWIRNSVFILLDDSFSFSLLDVKSESISSIKIILCWLIDVKVKRVLTNFSLSPIHFDKRELALIIKNLTFTLRSYCFITVFPVPEGPNKSRPFGGQHISLNKSGRNIDQIIISFIVFLQKSNTTMSSHDTFWDFC